MTTLEEIGKRLKKAGLRGLAIIHVSKEIEKLLEGIVADLEKMPQGEGILGAIEIIRTALTNK